MVVNYRDFILSAAARTVTYLPISVERFRCANVRAREVWAHSVLRQPANGETDMFTIDVAIYQDDGRFAAAIEGLSLKSLPPEALRPEALRPPVTTETGDSPKQTVEADAAIRSAGRGTHAGIRSQLKEA